MTPTKIEGYTVTQLAKLSKKSRHAVEEWLSNNVVKPVINELLYPPYILDKLLKTEIGRPTKYIKLFMGNPTKEKVNLFFNSAKKALNSFINAKEKFIIGFSLASSVKSPDKPIRPKNKEYNEIANLVMEIFEKQSKDKLTNEEALKYLKKAALIDREKGKELLKLIKEIESSSEVPKKPKK